MLVTCFFILSSGTFQIEVSADSFPISLNAAQTLALYGSSIPAMYYDGQGVSYITFDYWKSSKEILSKIEADCSVSPMISVYANQNIFGLDAAYWNNAAQSTSFPDWFSSSSGQLSQKQDFSTFEFLIYRWKVADLVPVKDSSFDFQLNLNQSLTLPGVERIRTFIGYSIDTITDLTDSNSIRYSGYHSQIDLYGQGSSIPFYTGTETRKNGSFYFGCAYMPVFWANGHYGQIPDALSDEHLNALLCPCPHMSLIPVDSGVLSSPVDLDHQTVNIRSARSVSCNEGTFLYPQDGFQYCYLIIACPVVWGNIMPPEPEQTTPNYSDQIDSIQTGVGDININLESTNDRLDQIIEQLDDIYENMGVSVDIDTTDIENSISNAASSIVSGIRGLFIPSQTDLINFRLNLQNDFQTHFPAFFTADDKVRNLYGIFSNAVSARSSITVPLVSMSVSDVAQNRNASFSFGGYEVPLKPNADSLGILYDSLAFIIDAVATLGLLNMLRSKLRKILSGGTES